MGGYSSWPVFDPVSSSDEEEKWEEERSDVDDDEPVVVKLYVSAERILWKTWSDGNITVSFLTTPADRRQRRISNLKRRTREWVHGDGRMLVKRARAANNCYY